MEDTLGGQMLFWNVSKVAVLILVLMENSLGVRA